MSNNVVRLEFAQFGHFTKFKVFRSPEPMVPVSMPEPIADNLKTMFFVDTAVPDGDNYYRVEVEREGEFILSEEMYIRVTNEWSPDALQSIAFSSTHTYTLVNGVGSWVSDSGGYSLVSTVSDRHPVNSVDSLVFDEGDDLKASMGFDGYFDNASTVVLSLVVKGFPSEYPPNQLSTVYKNLLRLSSSDTNTIIGFYESTPTMPTVYALRFRGKIGETFQEVFLPTVDKSDYRIIYISLDFESHSALIRADGRVVAEIPITSPHSALQGLIPSLSLGWVSSENPNSVFSFIGGVKALMLRNQQLSLISISKWEGYLAHKYSLTANLPDNHPYKWVKPIVAEDNKPYGIIVESTPDGVVFKYGVSGLFDTINYYVSNNPISVVTPPNPKTTGLQNTSHSDKTLVYGKHYARFSAIKEGSMSTFSEEVEFEACIDADPELNVSIKPYAFWKLQEASGLFLDSSGEGRDMTPSTAALRGQTPIDPTRRKSARLNGLATTNENRYVGEYETTQAVGSNFTVSMWVNYPSDATLSSEFFKLDLRQGVGFSLGWGSGGDNQYPSGGRNLNVGQNWISFRNTGLWLDSTKENYHIAVRWRAGYLECFLDGVLKSSRYVGNYNPARKSIRVGKGEADGLYGGVMGYSRLAVYDGALTDADILKIASKTVIGF